MYSNADVGPHLNHTFVAAFSGFIVPFKYMTVSDKYVAVSVVADGPTAADAADAIKKAASAKIVAPRSGHFRYSITVIFFMKVKPIIVPNKKSLLFRRANEKEFSTT